MKYMLSVLLIYFPRPYFTQGRKIASSLLDYAHQVHNIQINHIMPPMPPVRARKKLEGPKFDLGADILAAMDEFGKKLDLLETTLLPSVEKLRSDLVCIFLQLHLKISARDSVLSLIGLCLFLYA
jgi:hypothetical protein